MITSDVWLAVYDETTGKLLCRVPARVCNACGDVVTCRLDADGRCTGCGPAKAVCQDCDCSWPAEDLCSRGMRLVCPQCAEDREAELYAESWSMFDEFRASGA